MNQSEALLNELRPANPITILGDLIKAPALEKRLAVNAIPDGAAGVFRADDGNVYEIVVRPAAVGKFKHLFDRVLKGKK